MTTCRIYSQLVEQCSAQVHGTLVRHLRDLGHRAQKALVVRSGSYTMGEE